MIETPEEVTYLFSSYQLERGAKRYELANHLGNVLTVISDKKTAICTGNTFNYFAAERISATDYSPFGAPLAGRTWNGGEYRYGFGGQENVGEINSRFNHIDYGARYYNSNLGRWLSIDPMFSNYPRYSPYLFCENNPVSIIDIGGDSTAYYNSAGLKLFVSHDNLMNAIVIVDDKQLKAWTTCYSKFMNSAQKDSKVVNEYLRKKGTVILTNPILDFFKKFRYKVPLKQQILDNGQIITHFLINGKKKKLYGETQANLVMNGNTVTVGKNVNPTGGLTGSSAPDREPGFCGTIHTHPSERGDYFGITKENGKVPVSFGQSLSARDLESNDKVTIAVDPISIYVSTPQSSTIIFNKKEGFKR